MSTIKFKYPREAALVPHYDSHPRYTSVFTNRTIVDVLDALEVDLSSPCRFLDLGCGDGRLSIYLARRGFRVCGVDYSRVRIDTARERAKRAGVRCEFHLQDLHTYLEGCAESFDLIGCFEVLEHLVSPREVLEHSRSLLAPGGRIVGSVPLDSHYVAHLQVFESVVYVVESLSPDTTVVFGKHALCSWCSAPSTLPLIYRKK